MVRGFPLRLKGMKPESKPRPVKRARGARPAALDNLGNCTRFDPSHSDLRATGCVVRAYSAVSQGTPWPSSRNPN